MAYEAFCNITRNEMETHLKHKTVTVGDKGYKMLRRSKPGGMTNYRYCGLK